MEWQVSLMTQQTPPALLQKHFDYKTITINLYFILNIILYLISSFLSYHLIVPISNSSYIVYLIPSYILCHLLSISISMNWSMSLSHIYT